MHTITDLQLVLCAGFGCTDIRIIYTEKDRMLLYDGEEYSLPESIAADLSALVAPCVIAPATVYPAGTGVMAGPAPLLPFGEELVSVQFTDADGGIYDVTSAAKVDILKLKAFFGGLVRGRPL